MGVLHMYYSEYHNQAQNHQDLRSYIRHHQCILVVNWASIIHFDMNMHYHIECLRYMRFR